MQFPITIKIAALLSGQIEQRGGVGHAELENRLLQVIQPTAIDSVATTSGAAACPYSRLDH
jgi:hypothetical protein